MLWKTVFVKGKDIVYYEAIDTPFYCDYGKNIFWGSNVIININCTFVDNKPIRIGGGCILLPGVTTGENSVTGDGSVVNRPVPPDCVAAGKPCRGVFLTGNHKGIVGERDTMHWTRKENR